MRRSRVRRVFSGTRSRACSGDTAAVFGSGEAVIANGIWNFDLTSRNGLFSGTSLLAWAGELDGEVHVDFATDAQARDTWNIATLDSVAEGTFFELNIGGDMIAAVEYDTKIGGTGAYADWGFTLDGSILKFKNLA